MLWHVFHTFLMLLDASDAFDAFFGILAGKCILAYLVLSL